MKRVKSHRYRMGEEEKVKGRGKEGRGDGGKGERLEGEKKEKTRNKIQIL